MLRHPNGCHSASHRRFDVLLCLFQTFMLVSDFFCAILGSFWNIPGSIMARSKGFTKNKAKKSGIKRLIYGIKGMI